MNKLEALVSLNLIGDIGSIRLKKLLEFFGSPENILKAPAEKLRAVSGIGQNIADKICSLKKEDLDRELKSAEKFGLKILTQDDEGYPENLKNIYDPPIVLYVKGELKPEDKFSMAIVGSRKASYYGLTSAEKFASDLSHYGFTIVSGMARGIDTYAHKGALKAGGRTIAVMGSGFNYLYPAENRKLAEKIAENGAVISEFPCQVKPLPQNFPQRNRVISGLSLGILVVEAAKNSGALITADFALEQGREVFALPGKVDSDNSFGTNGLIKQGAKLVSGVEDIAEEFDGSTLLTINPERSRRVDLNNSIASGVLPPASKKDNAIRNTQYAIPSLLHTESMLYNALSKQPLSLDEIVENTRMSVSVIADLLLRLQMRKLVRQLPGKQFIRNENEK